MEQLYGSEDTKVFGFAVMVAIHGLILSVRL